MPFCEVVNDERSSDPALNNGIRIFYRMYGRGQTEVLLIIGMAGTHDSWGPQIEGLTGTNSPNEDDTAASDVKPGGGDNESSGGDGGIEVCAFDNRGMVRSSVPIRKSECTTRVMAKDAIAFLDHHFLSQCHIQ
ncbi:hypothetical protein SLA2020_329370 [Shorea laevis]